MKRTPLSPMSKKRRRDLEARRQVIRLVHERDEQCVFWPYVWGSPAWVEGDLQGAPVTCMEPLDVHEIIPRSAWSGGWLDPANCVLICRAHHQWVTEHPAEAHRIGLHGFSWERIR